MKLCRRDAEILAIQEAKEHEAKRAEQERVGKEWADEVASRVGEFYGALHLVESVLALGGVGADGTEVAEQGDHGNASAPDEGVGFIVGPEAD